MLDHLRPDVRSAILIALLAAFILPWLYYLLIARRDGLRQDAKSQETSLAVIREKVEFTGWGLLSAIMVVINTAAATAWWQTTISAPQEAVVALIWLGGTAFFGLGAALGRRRTYTVFRINETEKDG